MWWIVITLCGVVGGRCAAIERRSEVLWGIGTGIAAWVFTDVFGTWFFLAPIVALFGMFAGLWFLKARDARRRGHEF